MHVIPPSNHDALCLGRRPARLDPRSFDALAPPLKHSVHAEDVSPPIGKRCMPSHSRLLTWI